MGRVTLAVVTGISVTQFLAVGHIADQTYLRRLRHTSRYHDSKMSFHALISCQINASVTLKSHLVLWAVLYLVTFVSMLRREMGGRLADVVQVCAHSIGKGKGKGKGRI